MEISFVTFVNDVRDLCPYSSMVESTIDEDLNIIFVIEKRKVSVSNVELHKYYDGFRYSSTPYKEAVSKTVGHILQLIEKWYDTWH